MGRINNRHRHNHRQAHPTKSDLTGHITTNAMTEHGGNQQPQHLTQLKTNASAIKKMGKVGSAKYIPPHKRPDGPKSPTSPIGGKRKHPPKLPSPSKALTRPPSPKEIAAYSVPSWRAGGNLRRQVYRPQPVQMHPDTPFYSGAWLFDLGQAPTWLRIQLASRLAMPTRTPQLHSQLVGRIRLIGITTNKAKQNVYQLPPIRLIFYKQPSLLPSFIYARCSHRMTTSDIGDLDFATGAWLFDASRVPLWMQLEMPQLATALVLRRSNRCSPKTKGPRASHHSCQAPPNVGHVIKCGSVKAASAHPDDAFFTGSWLFDESIIPQWLAAQLPAKRQTKQVVSQRQQKQPMPSNPSGTKGKKHRSARKCAC